MHMNMMASAYHVAHQKYENHSFKKNNEENKCNMKVNINPIVVLDNFMRVLIGHGPIL